LREALFQRGVVKNLVQIDVPRERAYMHLDTIFTQIHHHHLVAYKPIVIEGLGSYVDVFRHDGSVREYPAIRDFLLEEINPQFEFILSGNGESPYQEREQWTDGCNLVAIKPGVAITYDRNPKTELAFRRKGYEILHAYRFLEEVKKGHLDPGTLSNTIITLPSNELSRARGGSHCMTCPILREDL
jgi:arginine deiminase